MKPFPRLVAAATALGCLLVLRAPAFAQNEPALKSAFEGQRVTVRIDMPGAADGVDIQADSTVRSLNLERYRNDLKRYGTAIHAGDSAMVTLVKVKKDLIEFQLDGGGFGTFGDDTSTSVNMPDMQKSNREKDLEQRIKEEKDAARKRAMERERDDLRNGREAENRLIRAERERLEERKRERIAQERLRGGSRFNVHYKDRVPAAIRAEDVKSALAEFVDFRAGGAVGLPPLTPGPPPGADVTRLRKGMSRADVEQLLGRGAQSNQRTAGELSIVTITFATGSQRVTADFVEDVLVRYTISSK